MPDTSIVEALRVTVPLPEAALKAAQADPETIADPVLGILERAARDALGLPEPDACLLYLGLHVLAVHRDERAFAPLLRILGQDLSAILNIFGDSCESNLRKILISTYDGEAAPLFAAILDTQRDDALRAALLEVATFLAFEGRIPRAELRAALLRFAEEATAADCFAWSSWEDAIAVLGFRDLVPNVLAARADGLLEADAYVVSEFTELLAAAEADPEDPQPFEDRGLGYVIEAIDELRDTAESGDIAMQGLIAAIEADPDGFLERVGDDPDAAWDALVRDGAGFVDLAAGGGTVPRYNPFKDVGRNDPCPCGSGRKFKKCCLPGVQT